MENASKALLIVGGLLIVLVLIGLGVMIYNSSRGALDEGLAQFGEQEVQSFNQRFKKYEGAKVRGRDVIDLLNDVALNNKTYATNKAKNIETTGVTLANIDKNKLYIVKVEVSSSNKTGFVDTVTISDVT